MDEQPEALEGLRVVELGNFMSAAFCGKLLADMGAEVIKVEPPKGGDECRRHGPFLNDIPDLERSGVYLYLNTNKLGVTLNIDTTTGRSILKELLKKVDVLVEDNPPQRMETLGLDYAALSEVNPRLIVTSITPFGQTGPYRDYKAYNLNICAAGGVCIEGTPEREPLTVPLCLSHMIGGVHGAMATLIALFARDKTGVGQHVDISEVDLWAAHHNTPGVQSYLFRGKLKRRTGHQLIGWFYPFSTLPCKDGYIQESAVQLRQWISFLQIMGGGQLPEWYSTNPDYQDRRLASTKYYDELDAAQAPWLMEHTKEEIFAMCLKNQVPFCPHYTMEEIVNHPHLAQWGYFVEIDHPETGPLKYPGAPGKFSETPWRIKRRAPMLGEDNERVYSEYLGYSKSDLCELRQAEVV